MQKPILDLAREITSGDRRRDYGRPLVNHLRIALMWSIQDERPVSPLEVAWKMITLKAAREIHTPKYDNMLDAIGYAACADDMARQCVELDMADTVEEGLVYLRNISVGQMFELMLIAKAADEDAAKDDYQRELERMDKLMASGMTVIEMTDALERRGYTVHKVVEMPADAVIHLNQNYEGVTRKEWDETLYRMTRPDNTVRQSAEVMTEAVKSEANEYKGFCPECSETYYAAHYAHVECQACGYKFVNSPELDDIPF